MSQLRLTQLKIIFVIIFFLIIYNEWLSFYLKIATWNKFPVEDDETVKMLLVADPQILSIRTEPNYPFSYIAVWDGNRLVSRGFHQALQFTDPDVVVFLGDLMDDGSIINDDEFVQQSHLFKNLLPISSKKAFYIPGDNDIGGEGFDRVSPNKIERFVAQFNSSNPTSVKFLNLYHISAIPDAVFKPSLNTSANNPFSIIFSHYPLTPGVRESVVKQVTDIGPSLIFSAHDHDSYEFIGKKINPKAEQFWLLREEGKVLTVDLKGQELHEVSVPTCSYRMGKQKFGFGYAIVNKSGILKYTVLWMPSRFHQLWMYFWGLCMCISMFIFPLILKIASGKFCTKRCSSALPSNKSHNG